MATLNIALVNKTTSNTVYAFITGQAIDNNNALFLLQSDGLTPYYPTSPSSNNSPLGVNCAISLGGPGSTTNVVIPHIAGGRVWFSIGTPLVFLLNQGPALVEPSVSNSSDPNIQTSWDFCEFTFNSAQLYTNITYVDFVCLPISLSLTNTNGQTQYVSGLPANGLATVCAGLRAQNAIDNAGWDQLIVSPGGQNLRALSPNNGAVVNPSLFSGYFDSYVDQVWSMYTSSVLSVDTQASWGTVTGQVSGDVLTFSGVGSFTRPSARDIFSCSTGPFAVNSPEMGNVAARLAAAFNRSTLLLYSTQPGGTPANYYQNPITNHYSRIIHAASLDGRGYAFPYDDVVPDGGTDQSGSVFDPSPSLLTISLGGDTTFTTTPALISAYSQIQAASYTSDNGTQTQPSSDVDGGSNVGWIHNGCWLCYNGVDFGSGAGATQFIARVSSGAAAGISGLVQVALDSPTATPAGSFAIANTGGWQNWETVPANISPITGVHNVYLTFASGQPADFVNVHWFTFSSPPQMLQVQSKVTSESEAQTKVVSGSEAQTKVASGSEAQTKVASGSEAQTKVASGSEAQTKVASGSEAQTKVTPGEEKASGQKRISSWFRNWRHRKN
jgi:Beta-1,3-glucanase/Carbohydrate binding module (family 6)